VPELPEVETMARDLKKAIVGKTIRKVWYDWPKMIHLELENGRRHLGHHPASRTMFGRKLRGLKVVSVSRRAKNVLIGLSGDHILAVHPKMTGHFLSGQWIMRGGKPLPASYGLSRRQAEAIREKVNSYIHFLLWFKDGSMLGYSDARKFGRIIFGAKEKVLGSKELSSLGPEPLGSDLDLPALRKILSSSRGRIKQMLLDQTKIAGIGNIYADEILWTSKVHPLRRANSLSDGEAKALFNNIKKVLTSAIKMRGTSMSDYRDASGESGGYMRLIKVYGREGEPCLRCRMLIKRIVIAARSAHFCPRCQRLA